MLSICSAMAGVISTTPRFESVLVNILSPKKSVDHFGDGLLEEQGDGHHDVHQSHGRHKHRAHRFFRSFLLQLLAYFDNNGLQISRLFYRQTYAAVHRKIAQSLRG